MKKILLSVAFVATSFLSVNAQSIADFSAWSWYGFNSGISGSTAGADDTYATSSGGQDGTGRKLDITITDRSTDTKDWFIRGYNKEQDTNNNSANPQVTFTNTGYFTFYAKTSTAPAGAKIGVLIQGTKYHIGQANVINDGAWHIYEFDLSDNSVWEEWTGVPGGGDLTGETLHLDALLITAPHADGVVWDVSIDDIAITTSPALSSAKVDLAKVNAYPNPVKNTLNLDLSKEVTSVTVYSSIGTVVYQIEAPAKNISIDTQAWNKGLYFVNIKEGNNAQTLKVVK